MSYSRNRIVQAAKAFFFQSKNLNKNKATFIGEDYMGNRYFEAERPNHFRKYQRFFERRTSDEITDPLDLTKVPPAWDAWLRFRRREPPSEEEVRESEEYFQANQAKAAEKTDKVQTKTRGVQLSGDPNTQQEDGSEELSSKGFPKLPFE